MNRAKYFLSRQLSSLCFTGLVLAGSTITSTCTAAAVTYDTAPYWASIGGSLGGMGTAATSTFGQTFIAPSGPTVTLNDFSFRAETSFPFEGTANLQMRAFVFSWSGSLIGHGGGAVGNPLYMSAPFQFSPPNRPDGWVPLSATIGGNGLVLTPGQRYVMGFTISNPADYAASQGSIEFQCLAVRHPPFPVPAHVNFGSGGAVWLNNSNNFIALNTTVWDTWGDIGAMAFTAHFTVVPEPSSVAVALLGVSIVVSAVTANRGGRVNFR
jgi:hypothetical protein